MPFLHQYGRIINNLLITFKHLCPSKPQLLMHKCLPISYDAKPQLSPKMDTTELLNDDHKHCIQEMIRSLLYYGCALVNKLVIALSAISARQAQATIATEQAVELLLDYVATYPNNVILYQSSNMALCAHADAGFLNESKSLSHAGQGAHLSLRR
jgi:hypothetical protein